MNEWLIQQGISSPQTGLVVGLLAGLVVAVVLASTYPFMKRFTHLPQVVLGMAFSWGIPMAFAAVSGELPVGLWLLVAANFLWTVVYDTKYAMVDREDDLVVAGIKVQILEPGATEPVEVSRNWSRPARGAELVLPDLEEVPVETEDHEARAALQALHVIEPGADIADIVDAHLTRDEARCCEPRPAAVGDYADAYRGYRAAVEAVTPLYSHASQETRQKP